MDKKAAIDDVDAIYARIQELKKEREPKPECPRNTGGSCLTACSNWSNCFTERQRAEAALTGGDFC